MEERAKFAVLAESGRVTMSELCGDLGISRRTGYKWLGRYREGGWVACGTRCGNLFYHIAGRAQSLAAAAKKPGQKWLQVMRPPLPMYQPKTA